MISKSHIEALIDLAARENKQELTACLVDNVRKISATTSISVYEVFNTKLDRERSDDVSGFIVRDARNAAWSGEPLAQHEGFSECVASKQIIRLQRPAISSTRIIFPVRGAHDVIGVLVIDCNNADAETLYMIEAMSQVWKSQQFLLDRNERDVLTGLLNRQALDSRMPHLFREAANPLPSSPIAKCLAMIDLDKFKEVNDRYGHLYGDEVLVHFVRLMTQSFRHYDYLFRYGGEEFVALLNNTDLEKALVILERFRATVASYDFPQVGNKTVSVGVIQVTDGQLPSTIMDKADKALYYAKQNGRNRICAYEQLLANGVLQENPVMNGDVELF
ncbi:MAG: GGDEF domain-containing protein [Gammaproteobacteria bacterium]|nr:GGDEF domain-containing protein [Gammaproteobacteria bacterium]